MSRGSKLYLGVCILLGCFVWSVHSAGAQTMYVGDPILNPSNEGFVAQVMSDINSLPTTAVGTNPATGAAYTAAQTDAGLGAMDLAAGTLGLSVLAPATVAVIAGGVAAYTGWKIGTADYKAVTDLLDPSSGSSVTTFQWGCFSSAGATVSGCSVTGIGGSSNMPALGTSSTIATSGWYASVNGTDSFCFPASVGGCTTSTAASNFAASLTDATRVFSTGVSSSCGSSVATGGCYFLIRPGGDMASDIGVTTSTASAYASAPTQNNQTSFTPPVPTAAQVSTGLQQCGAYQNATGSAACEAAIAALNQALNPAWQAGSSVATAVAPPFTLPEPTTSETYDQYASRLRELGYLGTITYADDAMPFPSTSLAAGLNPGSITELGLTPGSTVALYDRSSGAADAFPSTPPLVTPGTTTGITITKVPSTYTPTGPYAGGGAPIPGQCNCGSVSFTPITTVSLGTKFPFGVFAWLTSALGTIPTSGTPLSFTFSLPDSSTMTVDTGSTYWETVARPIVFPIVEFLMTVAMFYFVATKIIGLGGDD